MEAFDNLNEILVNIVNGKSNWVQRRNISFLDLEVCGGIARPDLVTRTCSDCVIL